MSKPRARTSKEIFRGTCESSGFRLTEGRIFVDMETSYLRSLLRIGQEKPGAFNFRKAALFSFELSDPSRTHWALQKAAILCQNHLFLAHDTEPLSAPGM